LTVIFAAPIARPPARTSVPSVLVGSAAASSLSLTIVPSSAAVEHSALSGFSVQPARKNSGALSASSTLACR
jgi:hypothetical protein